MSWNRWVGIALLALARPASPADDNYIEKVFQSRIGEVPKLGWFDPKLGFLAPADASQVFLYAPAALPSTGTKKGRITGPEVQDVQSRGLACEQSDSDSLTVFETGKIAEPARALFTTKKLPGQSRSGFVPIQLDAQQMAAVNRVLGWTAAGALRRDQAFAVGPEKPFYSFHRLYSSTTRLLRQEAVILHNRNGQIIALNLHRNIDTEPFCADCDNPRFEDAEIGVYRPLNMFDLSGFPYPVILSNGGTVEGRGLSLVTFTPTGEQAKLGVYEYVATCGYQ
jgi:hypothetical protein